MGKTVLLSGRPGVGKTTLIKAIVEALPGSSGGFYTQEVRSQGTRLGFDIVTLSGVRASLARRGAPGLPRVGRYGVYVDNVSQFAVPVIHNAVAQADCVVIDEIGKMELFCGPFRRAVLEAMRSPKKVVGTVMQASDPWADGLKHMPGVWVLTVTTDNRCGLGEVALQLLGP